MDSLFINKRNSESRTGHLEDRGDLGKRPASGSFQRGRLRPRGMEAAQGRVSGSQGSQPWEVHHQPALPERHPQLVQHWALRGMKAGHSGAEVGAWLGKHPGRLSLCD